jgi:PDZ domain-containing protein
LLAAVLIVIVSVINLDIPYFAITPGPAIDVVSLIDIEGAETKPVSGELLLTTVSLHTINVAEAIRSWFDENYEVLSRSAIIPSGETEEEAEQRSTDQMSESHEHAAAAALSFLGYDVRITPLGARVREVEAQAPARLVLRRGDVIVGADAASVKRTEDLVGVIKSHEVGDEIVLKVMRGEEKLTVKTRTVGREGKPSEPKIGVLLDTVPRVDLPLTINIESGDIGGPSAGLMYALGIVDLLDSYDLAGNRKVAGTGEISVDGLVLPVGGITQKIAGARRQKADLFLVPSVELVEACSHSGDMAVYAVGHLADAVRVLRDPAFAKKRSCP